ncbi:hypothetical protein MMC21_006601 [Puttea exsequens]|nr:hypothetical protein [Puttea exsequens]
MDLGTEPRDLSLSRIKILKSFLPASSASLVDRIKFIPTSLATKLIASEADTRTPEFRFLVLADDLADVFGNNMGTVKKLLDDSKLKTLREVAL